MGRLVYYLTGMRGQLRTGLGKALLDRGFDVTGRELVGEFHDLDFSQQVDTVAENLRTHFWHEEARVIANSFGAYLFLHAQAQLDPYIGDVVLLSPIVGAFADDETQRNFIPPRADKILGLAKDGNYPIPTRCEFHVGELDWQSNPENVASLGQLLSLPVTIVPGAGHMLPKEYVGKLLDRWAA